ncbi:MAG: CvpA family protein [Anaerolineales bacterium]|nr:CvpA family protein [Anaerolineales bacterium]
MVSIIVLFYIFVILFAIVGAMRGWSKEILVSFSVILALFLISVIENLAPYLKDVFQDESPRQFWFRFVLVLVLVFFGYQTPNISRFEAAARREKISDSLLGIFIGAINGYLIFGTIWYFMDFAKYPFKYFSPPLLTDPLGQKAVNMISKLPPAWLGAEPWVYLSVGVAFLFVLMVFI